MIAHTYAYISSRCRSCPTQRALSRCFTSKKKKCRSCPYNKLLFRMQNIKRRENSLGYEGKNMGNACTLMIMILICIIFLFRNHDLLFFSPQMLVYEEVARKECNQYIKEASCLSPIYIPMKYLLLSVFWSSFSISSKQRQPYFCFFLCLLYT